MTISSCPKCDEPVTIPGGADSSARVRCPLCAEEYTLADALQKLPPALVLLDAPAPSDELAEADAWPPGLAARPDQSDVDAAETAESDAVDDGPVFDFGGDALVAKADAKAETAEEEADDEPFTLEAPPDAEGAPAAFDFGGGAAKGAASIGAGAAVGARPKRKKKSVAAEMIKIGFGGAAAIPIAVLIMWWGMGRDFKELAPWVAKYCPAIVPEGLRGDSGESDETDDANNDANNDVNDDARGKEDETVNHGSSGGLPDFNPLQPGEEGQAFADLRNPLETNGTDASGTDGSGQTNNSGLDDIGLGGLDSGTFSTDPDELIIGPIDVPDVNPGVGKPLGVIGAPSYSEADLKDAVALGKEAAGLTAKILDKTVPKDERMQSLTKFYDTLCTLADKATHIDATIGGIEGQFDEIRTLFERLQNSSAIIANSAALRLAEEDRTSSGVVLAGTVTAIQPQGDLFETRLTLSDIKNTEVLVYSWRDPNASFQVDDRVAILGTIVDNPAENLRGYQGNAPTVVWSGLPIVLPNK